jgi:hypothetical protein
MWVNTAPAITIWLADELVVAVPHPPVVPACLAERLVDDEQDGAAFGGLRQIGGHRLAGADGGDAWPVAVGRERD